MNRPDIQDIRTGVELKRWYWLKEELVNYCKLIHLSYAGAKFHILERIASTLDNVVNTNSEPVISKQATSTFDWHSEKLSPGTVITDSYKNTRNVRRFFLQHCGDKFHFNIPFMAFMKTSCGKTLQYAIEEWNNCYGKPGDKGFKSNIPAGNQYNQYIRDFFADNPNRTMQEARQYWKLKRALPLGKHKYERTDLQLKQP